LRTLSTNQRPIRHTIVAGNLNHHPLVGQFLAHWYDYYWLNSWECLWRVQRGDVEYCLVSNDPKFSLADAVMLAEAAHAGELRILELNDIPAVTVRDGGK